MPRLWIWIQALAALTLTGGAGAQDAACPARELTVSGADAGLAAQICTTSDHALAQLETCALRPTGPLHVAVKLALSKTRDECLALFHCNSSTVEMLQPERLSARILPGGALGAIPLSAAFDSLLAHELTHAVIFQMRGANRPGTVAQEYMAYAMQLEFMAPEDRQVYLDRYNANGDVTLEEINEFLLMVAPERFAARAWLHFRQPGHGCATFARIMDGSLSFGSAWP